MGSPRRPRETKRERAARAARISRQLARDYPDSTCALIHANPLQLLVATILSAQCTDVRVNMVTPALFARYPGARELAAADPAELESLVKTTGFYRNKARHIRGSAQAIVSRFAGEVPRTMAELLALPGVARKTANVVLGTAFGQAVGVVVDTHVGRISRLLALTASADPVKVEQDLMALLPPGDWIEFSHRMIWHGRGVCIARRPACDRCPLAPDCPSRK